MNAFKFAKRSIGIICVVLSFIVMIVSIGMIVQGLPNNLDNSFSEENFDNLPKDEDNNDDEIILDNDETLDSNDGNIDEQPDDANNNLDETPTDEILDEDINNSPEDSNDESNDKNSNDDKDSDITIPEDSEPNDSGNEVVPESPNPEPDEENKAEEDDDNPSIEVNIMDKALLLIANSDDEIYNKTFYYFISKDGVLDKTKIKFIEIEDALQILCEKLVTSVTVKYGNVTGITNEMVNGNFDSIDNILVDIRNLLLDNRI